MIEQRRPQLNTRLRSQISLFERRPIRCADLVVLDSEYLEGALDATAAGRVERHLPGCPGCVAYLAQLRVTIRLAGTLPQAPVPAAERERLQTVFRRSG